jgi:hypothetical protein
MDRLDHDLNHRWHVALNRYNTSGKGNEFRHWMYEAKHLADEVARMAMLFQREREGKLPEIHRQCSHSRPAAIADNHLTCCLGKPCRACPHLLALEQSEIKPEEIDIVKAWTCAAHILSQPQNSIDTSEGYLKTVGDRMFWENVYRSF